MNLKMIKRGFYCLILMGAIFIFGGIYIVTIKSDVAVVYGNILIAMGITLLTNILVMRFSTYITRYCGYIFASSIIGILIVTIAWGGYTIFYRHSNFADALGITLFSFFMAALLACESEDLQKELKELEQKELEQKEGYDIKTDSTT